MIRAAERPFSTGMSYATPLTREFPWTFDELVTVEAPALNPWTDVPFGMLDEGSGLVLLPALTGILIMQSILEILTIHVREGVAKRTGTAYRIPEAHCVLRNDDNTVAAVGVLIIPKDLEEQAKAGGTYTAGFTLEAGSFGENQGRIVARLASLTPVQPGQLTRNKVMPAAAASGT